MIRGLRPHQGGYTVIEVITVLTISIALIGGAIALFSSRIPRTQFSQAVTELEGKIRGVANDVNNGYYPSANNIKCDAITGVEVSATPIPQGSNSNCIFLGKAIQFAPQKDSCNTASAVRTACDQLGIYTIWGKRTAVISASQQDNLNATDPKIISPAIGASELYSTPYGLYITKVVNTSSGATVTAPNGIAFLQTFGGGAVTVDGTDYATGSQSVELRVFNTVSPTSQALGLEPTIFASYGGIKTADKNPSNGVTICLRSGTTNQFATMTIGENNNPVNVKPRILSQDEWDISVCA